MTLPSNSVLCFVGSLLSQLGISAAIYFASIAAVSAQSATATLSGTIVDQNQAVITNANVSVISIAQGFQRSTTTNEEGNFVVPLLPPGAYIVKAERVGFATAELRNVVLSVNDQLAVKIEMKVGGISGESVTVVDGSSLTNESPAVATVINRNFVENIPLNGRSFQALISLTPGVVLTQTNVTEQGQFSVNGQRSNANYFTVDGVSANIGANASSVPGQSGAGSLPALSAFGGTNNLVSVDALQEFRMQTSTYAPEFGRSPGAQISIVTRAGTNEFHGSVFEYFRNDVLDANDWFANRAGLPRPALRQNDFGGVLGGPILKNRLFFFFSYEGLRLRQPQVGITSVPSLAARQAAPAGSQPFINLYPLPNGPATGTGLASFSSGFSNPGSLNATSVRIDAHLSSRMTVFGRYNHAPSKTSPRAGTGIALNVVRPFSASTQTVTAGITYLSGTTLTNDLRFNYSRNSAQLNSIIDDFGGATVPADSSVFPNGTSPSDSSFSMQIGNAIGSAIFWGTGSGTRQRQINLIDNLTAVLGNHQLKLGIDYRRLAPVIVPLAAYSQSLTFSGVGVAGSPAAGTLLSGRALQVRITSQKGPQIPIFHNLSVYAQDTWKSHPRLTLTYGIRWELVPPPHEANGNNPSALTQISDPATIRFAPPGTPLWKTTYNNFAPRFGLSYQLSRQRHRETIVRGGVGLFYDLGEGQASNAFAFAFPFTGRKVLTNIPLPLSPADAAAPIPGLTPTPVDSIYAFDPELKLPRIYQWNLAVEQSLGENQTISASYVAALGRRLLRLEEQPNVNPNFLGNFRLSKNDGTSDYHALQLQYRRQLSKGFQALVSFTLGKSIDNISTDAFSTLPADIFDLKLERGPSSFDVRRALNAAITYDLPSSRFKNRFHQIFSNWSVDGIVTARSAPPINVTYFLSTGTAILILRPDVVEGQPLFLKDLNAGGGRRINAAAFAIPTTLRQGSLGRNALRAFGLLQFDFGVRRQFSLGERIRLHLKTEIFNLFNHPNFGNPFANLGTRSGSTFFADPVFGQSTFMLGRSLGTGGTNGGFSPLYQVGGPRSMQLSVKVTF